MDSGINRPVSRRAVLIGGAALGAGALGAAGLVTGTRIVAGATGPMLPAPALVGATFDLFPFCLGTTWSQAADFWNAITGRQMHCWKVYFTKEGQFPTGADIDNDFANDGQLKTIHDRGIEALLCFKPARTVSPDQRTALANSIQAFSQRGFSAQVTLWQEVRPEAMDPATYKNLVKYYGPAVRSVYPLVYDAAGDLGPNGNDKSTIGYVDYDPGNDHVDGYAIDYYCPNLIKHSWTLDPVAAMAGSLPIGIWEMGNTLTADFAPTRAELKTYMDYIKGFLSQRLAAGLPVGSVAWYNGPAVAGQGGGNEIAGTDPNPLAGDDIARYRELYDAVDSMSPATLSTP
jgi:hypothetical protein